MPLSLRFKRLHSIPGRDTAGRAPHDAGAAWRWWRDTLLPLALVLCLALLAGCAPFPKVEVREPTTARAAPPQRTAQVNGAIFQQTSYRPLFEDNRARHVGDLLTIVINENISASQEKKSSASKTGTVTAPNASVILPVGGSFGANTITANGTSSNTFDGKGATNSTNAFNGTITVTVVDVLPNGNLVVSGEKQIGNNRQVETVRFSGVVNPVTIVGANTVSSTQVADARIELRGQGQVDEAQVMGWLARFFLTFLPF
ncbi:MAG: flagellar basal body L-ring protein FlgH [Burkholderiales bacterium]|nr:flagellar basal body L-ring protein FlgH [Burkholderiales bacterium]